MTTLNYDIMKAACQMLREEFHAGAPLGAYNLVNDDLAELCSARLWASADRIGVTRTLDAMRDGLAAGIGYSPFAVPAEWMAAVIVQFVHPINRRTACAWTADTFIPAAEIIEGGAGETVSAGKLFSLVLLATTDTKNEFRGLFDSKVRKAIAKRENEQ